MKVTDAQVATLRAQLAGDVDEHKRFLALLDLGGADKVPYATLIAAAFHGAIDRRFTENAPISDIISFVSDLRSRGEDIAESLDARVAERLIRHSLGEGSISDIDDNMALGAQIALLVGLVGDEQLRPAVLDAFVAEARSIADGWLASDGSTGSNGT